MLYYIYIGNNRIIIDHLSKVTGGMFVAVSSSQKAAKVIDGIRERYNISTPLRTNRCWAQIAHVLLPANSRFSFCTVPPLVAP